MAYRFCEDGHRSTHAANFCSACGAVLDDAEDESTARISVMAAGVGAIDSAPAGMEQLPLRGSMVVIKRGPGAGSRFVIGSEPVTIGRRGDSEVFLDDVSVSRRHAVIERAGEGHTVRDCGSLNGTYVNRHRVAESPLLSGDELQIGLFRLVFLAYLPSAGR